MLQKSIGRGDREKLHYTKNRTQEGGSNTTNTSNKRTSRTGTPKASHHQPLQKGKLWTGRRPESSAPNKTNTSAGKGRPKDHQ